MIGLSSKVSLGLLLLLAIMQAAASELPKWAVAVMPSGDEFNVEVARTAEERARGYMFREHVGPKEGMLFLFDRPGRHGFWMKNCKVSLDIIWLDENWSIAHIAHDQPPCPDAGDCPSIVPMKAGRYVLEIAAGGARKQKLELGQRLVILSEPAIP